MFDEVAELKKTEENLNALRVRLTEATNDRYKEHLTKAIAALQQYWNELECMRLLSQ